MAFRPSGRRIMILAGETSGDQHGARLVRAMQRQDPALSFFGMGGQALKRAGVEVVVDASTLSVVGITEAAAKIVAAFNALKTVRRLLKRWHPHLLILIDFPDFNLNVAGLAKKRGVPVLYYISPQIWAWRPGRVKTIGKRVDRVAVILPFEAAYYRQHDIPATFVGHPLIDAAGPAVTDPVSDETPGPPTLGLLPGSREKEIVRHLPVMLDAARILKDRFGPLKILVSQAPGVPKTTMTRMVEACAAGAVELSAAPVEDVLARCRLLVAASGTVTLEAAILGIPMVIIYKVSPISYRLGKALVRVPYVGLANLIAGKAIVPELIQDDACPEKIADAVYAMLCDHRLTDTIRRQMLAVRKQLGAPGASERVADIALKMMRGAGQWTANSPGMKG